MKYYLFISLALLGCAGMSAQAGELSITSLNIGAGTKGVNYQGLCTHSQFGNSNDLTIVGLRRYLGQIAVNNHDYGSDQSLLLLQEVDVLTQRNIGWNMPEYFANHLNQYMQSNGISNWQWTSHFSGIPYSNGQYGIATLSSASLQKSTTRFHQVNDDPHNHVYQSVKINADGEWFWVINTHFTAGDPLVAQQQLDEVLNYVDTLDPIVNVVIAGDFNIYRDGIHKTLCPSGGLCNGADHQQAYQDMVNALNTSGFSELGSYAGACWNNNTCSFKATGASYARMDYIFLRSANTTFTTNLQIDRPFVDNSCLLADHFSLNATLSW